MLRLIDHLKGMSIGATDGEIGTVKDAYFSDDDWTVRYLVVATGGWLASRKVLITPQSIRDLDWEHRRIDVELSREQVRKSPDIDTDKPVSRQNETSIYDYYGYPYYWSGPFLWGPVPFPSSTGNVGAEEEAAQRRRRELESYDPHLRSTNVVTGYHIEATDGSLGHVEDFIYDDRSWTIESLVVDTRNWLPGRHVLIGTADVRGVSWAERAAQVDLTREAVRARPEFDRTQMIESQPASSLLSPGGDNARNFQRDGGMHHRR